MKFFVCACLTLCAAAQIAAAAGKDGTQSPVARSDEKSKREAPLSSGGYHGPSYKYLPPGSGGVDVYSSHAGGGGGGYDIGSYSGSDHYHGSGGLGGGIGLSGGGGHGGGGLGGGNVETYVVQSSLGGHGSGGYKYGGSSFGSQGLGLGHSQGHKVNAFVFPSRGFVGEGHSGGGGGSAGVGGGYAYSNDIGDYHSGAHSSHLGSSFGAGSSGYTSSHGQGGGGHFGGSGSSGGSQAGYHYAPVGFGGSSGFGSSASFGGAGLGGGHGFSGHSGGHGVESHGSASFGSGSFGGGGHGGSAGYAYESPSISHSQSASHIPSTNYGVPSSAVLSSYAPKYQGSSSAFNSIGDADDTPSYALGHKGLGHFGYAASKPQVLNTNIISSNKYLSAAHAHNVHSTAPFKPSTFLGAQHEGGSSAYSSLPANYDAPSHYPTTAGYDYQQPSIQEPESSYLPASSPQSSYGPPAVSPTDNYLPPSSSYGAPHH